MKYSPIFLSFCIAGLSLMTEVAQANNEDAYLGQVHSQSEQTVGRGRSALWTLPDVATQYQSSQPTPEMQAAMQARQEGRILDALILLDEAGKSGQAGADSNAEINLLRTSFLLQGDQPQQALETLAPLLGNARYAADAYALTAMAYLQKGQMQQALDAANHAKDSGDGMLPSLALSYALQGAGRLAEAREVMRGFNAQASNTQASNTQESNTTTPPSAITLAREAELALMLDQIQPAKALVNRAQAADAAHPYVIAVSGLAWLIDGHAKEAKAAFETALQRYPKDAKALLGLGLAEIKLGNFRAGLQKLQSANEADPGNALILTYLGRAQQQLGQAEAARASWRDAQQADPKDPAPWLYQAQVELQANRMQDARESLREARARATYRSVYRGERLLREDEQLLQANLAEVQRRLGMESIAFHTLADSVGEKSAASLRNQADLLQGQRFGESARRSLLLQSLFNEKPGNLPAELDVYGDGAGQTGASTPQHGPVSALSAQQTSYNNYDELFTRRTALAADAIAGGKNTKGEQVRLGVGGDTLGLSLAQRKYKTDGFSEFDDLDNGIWNATVQWRPVQSTQVFVSRNSFDSQRGETIFPTLPWGANVAINDRSQVARLGMRHNLSENSEVRALWNHQQTDQLVDYLDPVTGIPFGSAQGSSSAHGAELQYRASGAGYATQWGVQQYRGRVIFPDIFVDSTRNARHFYAAWQQSLGTHWQVDAQLGWGSSENLDNLKKFADQTTRISRWLPKMGVLFRPDEATHVRLAAWQGMGISAAGDATLAPASLAGILLDRPDDEGKLVNTTSLSADRQLGASWLLEAGTQQRNTKQPVVGIQQDYIKGRIDESKLALRWQPIDFWNPIDNRLAVGFTLDHERIMNDPNPNILSNDCVNEQNLNAQQLEVRWFAAEKWTARLAWSHNRATGTQKGFDPFFNPILLPYQDGFNQADASLDWKPMKWVSLAAGVRNGGNVRFKYMDIDRLNPRFSDGQYGYLRLKLDW